MTATMSSTIETLDENSSSSVEVSSLSSSTTQNEGKSSSNIESTPAVKRTTIKKIKEENKPTTEAISSSTPQQARPSYATDPILDATDEKNKKAGLGRLKEKHAKRDQMLLDTCCEKCKDDIECEVYEKNLQYVEPLSRLHEGFKYHVYYVTKAKTHFDKCTDMLKHFNAEHKDSELHPDSLCNCSDMNQQWYQSHSLFTEKNSIILSSPAQACIQTIREVTGNRKVYIHSSLVNVSNAVSSEIDESKAIETESINYSIYAGAKGPRQHERNRLTKKLFDDFWDGVLSSEPAKALTGENRYIIVGGHAKWLRYMSQDVENDHHEDWHYLARVQVPHNTVVRFYVFLNTDRQEDAPVSYGHPSIAFAMHSLSSISVGAHINHAVGKGVRKSLEKLKDVAEPAHGHADSATKKVVETTHHTIKSATSPETLHYHVHAKEDSRTCFCCPN